MRNSRYSFGKLEILLRVFRQVVLGVRGRFQYVVESPLADTIHRIYVPPPDLPVRNSLPCVKVIYPVDVNDPLLITHTVPVTHIAIMSVHNLFTFWLVRTDVKRHLAAHRHTAAPFTLRTGEPLQTPACPARYLARTVTPTAKGDLRRFLYFLSHCSFFFFLILWQACDDRPANRPAAFSPDGYTYALSYCKDSANRRQNIQARLNMFCWDEARLL